LGLHMLVLALEPLVPLQMSALEMHTLAQMRTPGGLPLLLGLVLHTLVQPELRLALHKLEAPPVQ